MDRLIQFTVLIIFLSTSCQETKKETSGILTKQELTSFLVEVYLAEARVDNLLIARDSAIKIFIPFEKRLQEKYSLADSTLKKTYQYYLDHPKEMEAVYDAVIDSLSLREQRVK